MLRQLGQTCQSRSQNNAMGDNDEELDLYKSFALENEVYSVLEFLN